MPSAPLAQAIARLPPIAVPAAFSQQCDGLLVNFASSALHQQPAPILFQAGPPAQEAESHPEQRLNPWTALEELFEDLVFDAVPSGSQQSLPCHVNTVIFPFNCKENRMTLLSWITFLTNDFLLKMVISEPWRFYRKMMLTTDQNSNLNVSGC